MSDYAELKARLSIKADMIQLGEKIEWGSDSAIMREAAAAIDALERERDAPMDREKQMRFMNEAAKRRDERNARWSKDEMIKQVLREPAEAARAALQEDKSHE